MARALYAAVVPTHILSSTIFLVAMLAGLVGTYSEPSPALRVACCPSVTAASLAARPVIEGVWTWPSFTMKFPAASKTNLSCLSESSKMQNPKLFGPTHQS